jgi:hypothetical protein
MQGKERTFTPEVEKVWNKDYQCEYYRGVIIDGEDNIVERCTRTHASYDAALDEAKKKMGILQRPYGIYTQLCRYQIIRSICKNVVSGGRHEYI